jgi:hypothetical protein
MERPETIVGNVYNVWYDYAMIYDGGEPIFLQAQNKREARLEADHHDYINTEEGVPSTPYRVVRLRTASTVTEEVFLL